MCGIIGVIAKENQGFIQEGIERIAHRGPDDSGLFSDDFIALGQRRLSIQDLSSNGHQPMFTQDGRYCIIFNGEIYNHWEIRAQIESKYPFKSSSDTETILYGYIEYGENIFNQLNGIFALAIYDTQTQDCIIVRDQFGIKPLYYYQKDNVFGFASEIKALSVLPNFDTTLNHEALINYLHFLYSPAEKTPFLNVKKLLGGHYIKFNAKEFLNTTPNEAAPIQAKKYYDIPFNGQYSTKTEAELIDELDEKLFNAVKRQLLSDVPVGFFLSGGLDSSAVVAMAKKAMPNKRLKCYTIDAGEIEAEGFANDLHYAKLVAKHLDVDLEIVEGKVDIIQDFDKMIYHLDEPQADAAPLHVLNICKKARQQGYIVLLGGTAGDDLFSGYRRHQALGYEKFFEKIPLIGRKFLKKIASNAILSSNNNTLRRIKKILNDIDKTKLERMAGYYAWLNIDKNKNLFNPNIKKEIENYYPSDILINSLKNIPSETSELNQMLYWEMKYFLTDHNLNYTDKLSMAVGVEVRVPFLDKELVEFSVKIPPDLKLKGKTTKYLLKKVMERYLPKDIIYRPKSGFGAPIRDWILNDLRPLINERLNLESLKEMNVFSEKEVQLLINENQKGNIDASYSVLCLLSIVSWIKQFKDVSK
ncbi:asparagine synthase (glutamine-hydrolyzing) [Emticicia sp.]|uniref:asparagine synthase (glutamine-hydrolyzing) n=1 Tax=Emticicia sp. TaxID=1930953 RepID=UPI003753DA01